MYSLIPIKLATCLAGGTLLLAALAGCGRKEDAQQEISDTNEPRVGTAAQDFGADEPPPPLSADASDRALLDDLPAEDATLPAGGGVATSPGAPATDTGGYEAWFERYGLDLTDPKMLDRDEDGDGYSNRDEFLVDTDPTDAKSRPGFHPVMRLVSYEEVDLPMKVASVDGRRAKIVNDSTGETTTVEKGDSIPGTNYVVDRVTEQVESDKFGEVADVSRVIGRDRESGELINFMIGLRPRSQSTSARLVSTQDPSVSVEIRQGQEFNWPTADGEKFVVVDLRTEQAVVKQLETGDVFTVPLERPKQ